MKKKISWMLLSFLMVAALVLTACPAPVGEQEEEEEEEKEEEEEEEEEPAVGEPQYGGTLTFKPEWVAAGPPNWNRVAPAAGGNIASSWASPFLEPLVIGDIERFGARGTGETPFQFWQWVPEQYNKGLLAESWELTYDPFTVAFHIRPGIMWTGNAYMGVEPREFTAYDVEYGWRKIKEAYAGWLEAERVVSITAMDKYTVVFEYTEYHADWMGSTFGGHLGNFPARETVEAGGADWMNQMGTGPFILADYVGGSYVAFDRNPKYWQTTTINGKEYQLPFIDELVWVIITDEATKIAAIRTGAVDWDLISPLKYSDSLAATSPELIQDKFLWPVTWYAGFKCDEEPWTDVNVRRAMMIGTDLEAIGEALYGEYEVHAYPVSPAIPWYTPMDELPESAKVLFSNDPELAKKMLADAGYPDGFSMKYYVHSGHVEWLDAVPMLTEMWARFGVKVEMIVSEAGVHGSLGLNRTYEDSMTLRGPNRAPYLTCSLIAMRENTVPGYHDAGAEELYNMAVTTRDEAERDTLFKELFIYLLEDLPVFPIPTPYVLSLYWPWVKNYYGEISAGCFNYVPMMSRIWIDQDLKAELGY